MDDHLTDILYIYRDNIVFVTVINLLLYIQFNITLKEQLFFNHISLNFL